MLRETDLVPPPHCSSVAQICWLVLHAGFCAKIVKHTLSLFQPQLMSVQQSSVNKTDSCHFPKPHCHKSKTTKWVYCGNPVTSYFAFIYILATYNH